MNTARLIVVCGTGGVGKTSISAALAIRQAALGRRVCLITIDPAKRLAHAMGIEGLGDEPRDLTAALKEAFTRSCPQDSFNEAGRLHALMPDTSRSLERFITQISPNEGARERVFANPVYQVFAREFSGTNEYMALQKVLTLSESQEYDLIVLDTPPSQDTIDFLEAPSLLARMFDEKLVHLIALPTHRLFAGGVRKALGVLEKLTGSGFMTHFFDFARSLYELRHTFSGRLKAGSALLRDSDTRFVLVSAPRDDLAEETEHFVSQVETRGFYFDGIILNRSLRHLEFPDQSPDPAIELLKLQARAQAEHLSHVDGSRVLAEVPELARDVHSIEDLCHVATHLKTP